MISKILFVIFGLLTFRASYALETDQYMMWDKNIKDISYELNQYITSRAQIVLDHINRNQNSLSCSEVAIQIIDDQGGGKLDRIEKWGLWESGLDRYPDSTQLNNLEIANLSMFYKVPSVVKKNFEIGVNLKVNGIHIGVDKLSHMFEIALGYYKVYLDRISKGESTLQAYQAAIYWGTSTEFGVYGLKSAGIFSYADLEANWQGFLFIKSFCEKGRPLLVHRNGQWKLSQKILNVSKYVNPYMDESYNHSYYVAWRWSHIFKPGVERYCSVMNHPLKKKLFEYYSSFKATSLSYEYVEEMKRQKLLPYDSSQAIEFVCQDTLRGGNELF